MKFLLLFALSLSVSAKVYQLDPTKSNVDFEIYKFKIDAPVAGKFKTYKASYDLDKDQLKDVIAEIEVSSIFTDHEKRDNHLKDADFFDVSKYPKIIFKSIDTLTIKDGEKGKLKGNLTIKDKSLPVILELERKGNNFTAMTKIDRYQYNLTWNKRMDKESESLIDTIKNAAKGLIGKYVISNEVQIKINAVGKKSVK
jgi:polyisoprenoid-binding protein YceI